MYWAIWSRSNCWSSLVRRWAWSPVRVAKCVARVDWLMDWSCAERVVAAGILGSLLKELDGTGYGTAWNGAGH